MRVSRETMNRHHDDIVTAASKMLRGRGIDRTSVTDLMRDAGMTHGGFYRHFPSKDALIAKAVTATFDTTLEMLAAKTVQAGARAALANYVAGYLSIRHVDTPADGCPIPALGAEITRESALVRDAYARGAGGLRTWIKGGLAGPRNRRSARAAELLSLLVGAVLTARAANNTRSSCEILASARQRAEQLLGK